MIAEVPADDDAAQRSNLALERLRDHVGTGRLLSPKYGVLADYVLREPDRVAFMTAAELARVVGVSEATVIRFAASLSFSGYPEFQREFQRMLRDELTTVRRMQASLSAGDAAPESTIAEHELANIRKSFENLASDDVRAVAEAVLRAGSVRVVGLRASACLAAHLAYQLSQMLPNVEAVTRGGADAQEAISGVDDVLVIAFAFKRYPRETVELVAAARESGLPIVAITDSFRSPICDRPAHVLLAPVSSPTFVDLFAAPLAVASAIAYDVSRLGEQRALEGLERFERRADGARLFWDAAG
jgi:DNA-binding MurR/RpiR family transcriptional regulator